MTASPLEYSMAISDVESGYVSASSSEEELTEVFFTKPHLRYLNKQLKDLEPQEILKWAILSIPNLYQTTAFGLTGLVTIDMLSKLSSSSPIDLIFFDTLHHFNETLELVEKVQARYPHIKLHIYKPQDVNTDEEFAAKYGINLWETDDERYDWLAKVEPAQRAYAELSVKAALTGRRKSQGGKRGDLDIIEVDDAGMIKINPLANWSFAQVQAYIKENNVPYNALLDMGYKSVGDWHSTQPVAEGEDERAGRWKGKEKTECGIHNSRSRYALYLMEQEQLKQQQELAKKLSDVQTADVEMTMIESVVMEEQRVEISPVEAPAVQPQANEVQLEEQSARVDAVETLTHPVGTLLTEPSEATPLLIETEETANQPTEQLLIDISPEVELEAQPTEFEQQPEIHAAVAPHVERQIQQIEELGPIAIEIQPQVLSVSS